MCRVLVPGAFLKVECGSFEKCNVALLAGDVLVGCARCCVAVIVYIGPFWVCLGLLCECNVALLAVNIHIGLFLGVSRALV